MYGTRRITTGCRLRSLRRTLPPDKSGGSRGRYAPAGSARTESVVGPRRHPENITGHARLAPGTYGWGENT